MSEYYQKNRNIILERNLDYYHKNKQTIRPKQNLYYKTIYYPKRFLMEHKPKPNRQGLVIQRNVTVTF